jgi:hypothetical protein
LLSSGFRSPADLPPIAFEQAGLYRLQTSLMSFYGTLLLVTPAFSALARGRLPIEISTRGARFADEADRSAELNRAAIERLERTTNRLAQHQVAADVEIEFLKRGWGDNR